MGTGQETNREKLTAAGDEIWEESKEKSSSVSKMILSLVEMRKSGGVIFF